MKIPSPEQINALKVAVRVYGRRRWKKQLSDCWQKSQYPKALKPYQSELQTLRNEFGPSWLKAVNLEDLTQNSLGRVIRFYRTTHRLSQRQLAAQLQLPEIDRHWISSAERFELQDFELTHLSTFLPKFSELSGIPLPKLETLPTHDPDYEPSQWELTIA